MENDNYKGENKTRVHETRCEILALIEKKYPEITDDQYGQLGWKIRALLNELEKEIEEDTQA